MSGPEIIMALILMLIGGGALLTLLAIIWAAVAMVNKIIYEVR